MLYDIKTGINNQKALETIPKYIWDDLTQREKIKYKVPMSL